MHQKGDRSDDVLLTKRNLLGWKTQDADTSVAKLLGVEGDYVAHGIDAVEAEEVIEKITKNGKLNARQAVEAAKEAFGKGITPDFPPDVNQMPKRKVQGSMDQLHSMPECEGVGRPRFLFDSCRRRVTLAHVTSTLS